MPAEWAGRPVLVRWQLERPMYDFKNSFSPAFVYIHRAKYIFSRDMFCLPHFGAKIHGVLLEVKLLLFCCLSSKCVYSFDAIVAHFGDTKFSFWQKNQSCHCWFGKSLLSSSILAITLCFYLLNSVVRIFTDVLSVILRELKKVND